MKLTVSISDLAEIWSKSSEIQEILSAEKKKSKKKVSKFFFSIFSSFKVFAWQIHEKSIKIFPKMALPPKWSKMPLGCKKKALNPITAISHSFQFVF